MGSLIERELIWKQLRWDSPVLQFWCNDFSAMRRGWGHWVGCFLQ